MTTGQIYIILSIALGVITLGTALVKAIYKVAKVNDTIENLSQNMVKLIERIDVLEKRSVYEDAVRNSQRRR